MISPRSGFFIALCLPDLNVLKTLNLNIKKELSILKPLLRDLKSSC